MAFDFKLAAGSIGLMGLIGGIAGAGAQTLIDDDHNRTSGSNLLGFVMATGGIVGGGALLTTLAKDISKAGGSGARLGAALTLGAAAATAVGAAVGGYVLIERGTAPNAS